jgi:RimJ/RimL family protein N-acetyltransferase
MSACRLTTEPLPTVPELTTARLRLRAHVAGDLDAATALWGDAGVVRYIGGKTSSRSETWARLLRYRGMWAVLGYGFWVVEDRTTRQFLGEVGLLDARREIQPAIIEPEVGVAREALAAALDWADRELPAPSLVCMIEPANLRSTALAARFGFEHYASTVHAGSPVDLFRRRRFAKP